MALEAGGNEEEGSIEWGESETKVRAKEWGVTRKGKQKGGTTATVTCTVCTGLRQH